LVTTDILHQTVLMIHVAFWKYTEWQSDNLLYRIVYFFGMTHCLLRGNMAVKLVSDCFGNIK